MYLKAGRRIPTSGRGESERTLTSGVNGRAREAGDEGEIRLHESSAT